MTGSGFNDCFQNRAPARTWVDPMEEMMVFFSARETTDFGVKRTSAATFLKVAARACAFVTWILATIVLSWQAGLWVLTGEWNSFPISRVIALAGFGELLEIHAATDVQRIFDWSLDLPTSGFLLAAAAILIGFSAFAASVEDSLGRR
jgi:hypothetical protein